MSNRRLVLFDDETALFESRKRRRILRIDDDEEEEQQQDEEQEEEEECFVGYNSRYGGTEKEDSDLKPLGNPIEVFGQGNEKTSYYGSLLYNGLHFQLEDTVLLDPEHEEEKPYVAIIKEILKTREDPLKITVQWLYRPEEAVKRGGGTYQQRCTGELLLSFHTDEVHAESIMHACVVHFLALTKQIPVRKHHPGFVVQYVYDYEEFKLYNIADRDYKDVEQHEIDRLLRKTIEELGDLPDVVEPKPVNNERLDKKRSVLPVDFSPVDKGSPKFESFNLEASERTSAIGSEYYTVLSSYKLLTKTRTRNKWLEKLLGSVQSTCTAMSQNQKGREEGNEVSKWPREAVFAIAALEKAADSALSADPGKYKRKMWQLVFNLKNNDLLALRLLNKELEPSQIVNMSPEELKTGSIAEEIPSRESEDVGYLQMTEASCPYCSEKKVALMDIFQTGNRNRYQMQCQACAKRWHDWTRPE